MMQTKQIKQKKISVQNESKTKKKKHQNHKTNCAVQHYGRLKSGAQKEINGRSD